MRRVRASRLFFLVCILAGSSSIGARRVGNELSSQIDGLDRILSDIPISNVWARWGMEWARWGKNFARMWQLPTSKDYGASSRKQRYSQSRNGGMYPGLPYGRQPTDGFYPGEQPYDQFDGLYSGNGRGRYPPKRRSSPPSYYGTQAPRTLSSSHGYDSDEFPTLPEYLLSDSAELHQQDQLMSESELQKPSTLNSRLNRTVDPAYAVSDSEI